MTIRGASLRSLSHSHTAKLADHQPETHRVGMQGLRHLLSWCAVSGHHIGNRFILVKPQGLLISRALKLKHGCQEARRCWLQRSLFALSLLIHLHLLFLPRYWIAWSSQKDPCPDSSWKVKSFRRLLAVYCSRSCWNVFLPSSLWWTVQKWKKRDCSYPQCCWRCYYHQGLGLKLSASSFKGSLYRCSFSHFELDIEKIVLSQGSGWSRSYSLSGLS